MEPDRAAGDAHRPFHLLGPCPICGASVPLAAIVRLADLGVFLAEGPAPIPDGGWLPDTYPVELDGHSAHRSACRFRAGTT